MPVASQTLLAAKYAENSNTTQYTVPSNRRAMIDRFTATNNTGSDATFQAYVVPSGGSAGNDNLIQCSVNVPAGEYVSVSAIEGHTLEGGDFIVTNAGTASAITIMISGREIS